MRGRAKTAGAWWPYSHSERMGLLGMGVQSISMKDHMNLSETLELWYPLGGNANCEPLWKTVWQFGKQLIICDPASLVLYPGEMERHSPQTLVR